MLRAWVKEPRQRHVMTVNNEMLVESVWNPTFKAVLQSTALNVPDSTGLLLGAKLTRQQLSQRVPGIDLVIALCASLDETTKVFLLGSAEGIAGIASQELRKMNPKLTVVGTFSGSPKPEEAVSIIQAIHQSGANLLLVAFGAPQQDLWIREHFSALPTVHVAIGVGGTFDMLAGFVKRAPVWMRSVGLEWLWRFVHQPSRWKRMWNAVIVFPVLVLWYGKQK